MAAVVKKETKSSTKTSAAKQNEDITDSNVKDIVSDNDAGDSVSDSNTDNSMPDANSEIVSDDAEEALVTATEISAEMLTENLKLYAKTDILFHNRRYGLGDELPTNDVEMVEAWERADTAEWR